MPPLLTADLPGTGGTVGPGPEDFFVEELPEYPEAGRGDHVFVTIEKTDLTTLEAVRRLARALGVREGDVGTAGLKDRHAVTRQRLSLPPPVTPEAALAISVPGVRVLSAARHPHKLRTGHLAGNRFRIRLVQLLASAGEAEKRARAILERLAAPPGMPNFFGAQRFGARGENVERGRALVRGEKAARSSPRERRLLVSAYQAAMFNRWLDERMRDGLFASVIEGDILRKTDTGGMFATTALAVDRERLAAGEVVATGPMFGHRMLAPAAGSEAARREARLLEAEGLAVETFARLGGIAEGTRRPAAVRPADAAARATADALEITFSLPPGAFATVCTAEITHVVCYAFPQEKGLA